MKIPGSNLAANKIFFRLPIPTGVSGQIKSKQRCASVPVLKSTEEIKDFPFRWDKKPEITGLVGQALVLYSYWLSRLINGSRVRI